jgi:hypothetical protein
LTDKQKFLSWRKNMSEVIAKRATMFRHLVRAGFKPGDKDWEHVYDRFKLGIHDYDLSPLTAERDILEHIWMMSYGHKPVPFEVLGEDDFTTLLAVRLYRDKRLDFVQWKVPGQMLNVEGVTVFEDFEGFQLHANR